MKIPHLLVITGLIITCAIIMAHHYFLGNAPDKPHTDVPVPSSQSSKKNLKNLQTIDQDEPFSKTEDNEADKKNQKPDRLTLKKDQTSQSKHASSKFNVQQGQTLLEPDRIIDLEAALASRVGEIIKEHDINKDDEQTFNDIAQIQNDLTGETLHTALKKIAELDLEDAKQMLIDIFLDQFNPELTDQDKHRILTYINTDFPLTTEQLDALTEAYAENILTEANNEILIVIATTGWDDGAAFLIDLAESENDFDHYVAQLTALGQSKSIVALDYLHQTLDILIQEEEASQDVEMIEIVRSLIINHPAK